MEAEERAPRASLLYSEGTFTTRPKISAAQTACRRCLLVVLFSAVAHTGVFVFVCVRFMCVRALSLRLALSRFLSLSLALR